MKKTILSLSVLTLALINATNAYAGNDCGKLPKAEELKAALQAVANQPADKYPGGGRGPLWMTLVDPTGVVCAVVHSLDSSGADAKNKENVTLHLQPFHRLLSARKASTSAIFSSSRGSIASGHLYSSNQPGGLLQEASYEGQYDALEGDAMTFGTKKDPMIGHRVGGFIGLGGGLALFDANKNKVGAIGVSGDTPCTTHVLAWQIREALAGGAYAVANIPFGLSGSFDDKLILDITPNPAGGPGHSASGYGHIECQNTPTSANEAAAAAIEFH